MELEFESLVEEIKKLSPEEKREIYFLTCKYIIEDERERIFRNYQDSLRESQSGQLEFSSDVDELRRLIEND